MNDKIIREIPMHSMKNAKEIRNSMTCGCYKCCNVFPKEQITKWTDNGQTALCPICEIDSVVAESSGIPLNTESLKIIHDYWFKNA